MKFLDFLSEKTETSKVVVVYGGGFQPFHAGHMSSYEEAKHAFPKADFYVASSNDVKVRPIPFADKKFLAQQAGVTDQFVQVVQPVNPQEILSKYNPDKDILILVRSERDPVNYTKKDGSPAYYQPFKSLKDCKPFNPKGGHGYIFVTKKKIFKVEGKEIYSGTQVRDMYTKADDAGRKNIIKSLYPKANHPEKVKRLLDKYIGGGIKESLDESLEDFLDFLTEGVHDKGIFKAVFLGGGPGSGKDYVLSKTLDGHGLTEINSDKALEFLMDKNNLDMKMPASEKEAREVVRDKAKTMTELRQKLALLGRNGLIINGTGDDAKKIKKIKDRLEELGYESSMIMVNTRDEVSAARNVERGQRGGRTVPEDIRKKKWEDVQAARPELAKMFGDNYSEIDNSEDLRSASPEIRAAKEKEMLDLFKKTQKFISKPPKNDVSKQWIAKELNKKDTLPIQKGEASVQAHPESKAADAARSMGLEYYGFGRYGKNGKVTHRSVHDKLVDVTKFKPLDEQFESFLSGSDSINMLTLGASYEVVDLSTESSSISSSELDGLFESKEKLLKDKNGNVRVFMLRAAAAKEAHHNGGTVYPNKNTKQGGYVIKLNEEKQDGITNLSEGTIFNESRNETRRITLSEARAVSARANAGSKAGNSCACEDSCACGGETTGKNYTKEEASCETKDTKITLAKIRARQNKEVKESIDKGTEPGLSMAASGESIGRDMGEKIKKKDGKVTVVEMQGDETTASIGDKKEDELKKQGISLSSFKAKRTI